MIAVFTNQDDSGGIRVPPPPPYYYVRLIKSKVILNIFKVI